MDNKLFKRIVAVAASAVMLTSSAFATVLTVGEDAWNDTAKSLTFSYDPAGATKVTYLAYAAREAVGEETGTEINGTKYVFGEIVAVNQLDGSEVVAEGATLNVPVNSDLLTVGEGEAAVNATHIVLMSGADNADTADVEVVTLVPAKVEYTITFNVDGTTSTATTVDGKVTAPTAPTKDGFTFKGWGITADATTVVDLSTEIFAADTTLYAIFEANAPAGPTVTFKNGTEETVVSADATGKVALPTAPTLTPATGTNVTAFTFVAWVDEAGNEFTAETVVSTDTTVYAKFDTGIVYGDANGDGAVNVTDRNFINTFVGSNGVAKPGKVNQSVYPGIDDIFGDANGDKVVNVTDRNFVNTYVGSNGVAKPGKVTQKIYYINK